MSEKCPHCFGTNIIQNGCMRCGAPVCCDDCCKVGTAQLLLHLKFPLSRKAFDGLMHPKTESRTWPLLFDRSLDEPWTLTTSNWFDLGRITEWAIKASTDAKDTDSTRELIRYKQHIQGLIGGHHRSMVLYAHDEEDYTDYAIAVVPIGMDPEAAVKIAESNLKLNNECIAEYHRAIESESKRLDEKYPITGERLDLPRWKPGLSSDEITPEMRAERDRIKEHNRSFSERANKINSERSEEEHSIGVNAITGRFPDWTVKRVADGRASKKYRKYHVQSIGSMADPESKF